MSGYPYIFQDLVDAGILRPVQPSASSGWTKYKTGREFSPGIVPGAVLDLHAERANGGTSPGVNSPPTTTWYDVSGNGNHGTLVNVAYEPVGRPHTNADADRDSWYSTGGHAATGTISYWAWDGSSGWAGSGTEDDPYALLSGGGGYLDVPSYDKSQWPTTFTLEAWFYLVEPGATNKNLVYGHSDANPDGGHLFLRYIGDSKLQFVFQRSAAYGGSYVFSYNPAFTAGWHHVAWTYNGSTTTTVYIDGVQVFQRTDVSNWSPAGMKARFLSSAVAGTKLAALRLYGRVLSASEVQAHYALGKGATGGYSVSSLYLNLCAARAVVPSGWVGSGTRDDPYALRLDGYNDEVVIARNGWGLSALSLEAWVRLPAELWGGHGLILSNGSIGSSGSPSRFTLFIAGYGATYVVQTGVNDGGTMYEAYASLPLNGGGWRHFVSTRAGVGSPMRVYIDGQFVKEGGGKRAVPDDPDPTVVLGKSGGTGKPRQLDAPLAAARIYDRPLDAAEVAWLYARGPAWTPPATAAHAGAAGPSLVR